MTLITSFLQDILQLPACAIDDAFREEAQKANASSKKLAILVAVYAKKLNEESGLSALEARRTAVRYLAASSNHAVDTMRRYLQIGTAILDGLFDDSVIETLPVRVLGVLLRIYRSGDTDLYRKAVEMAMNGASLEDLNKLAKNASGNNSDKPSFYFRLGILWYTEGGKTVAVGGLNVVEAQENPLIARGIKHILQALKITVTEEVC